MILVTNNGYVARFDSDAAELIARHTWHGVNLHGCRYIATNGYGRGSKTIHMHRLILGEPGGIDHINGDGCDNRRENLRPATQSQNCANAKPRTDGTSRYKGVSWHTKSQKWLARITQARNTKCLGSFSDEDEAAIAYNTAARLLFGDYARLNSVT